jgi:hypothetical protein
LKLADVCVVSMAQSPLSASGAWAVAGRDEAKMATDAGISAAAKFNRDLRFIMKLLLM